MTSFSPSEGTDYKLQDISLSDNQQYTLPNFSPNRNFNTAVAVSPLRHLNVETALSRIMTYRYLARALCPADSNGVKDELFNEKSNYYSRFGQTDPDCVAGKWRTCSAFYRISGIITLGR